MRAELLFLAGFTSGCGYALMQTGHTEPPGKLGAAFGTTYITNELSGVAGRDASKAIGAELAPRVGVSDHVDIGVQPWFVTGARADVKVDVFDPLDPLAIAPRAGVGYAEGDHTRTLMALLGGIASYRLTPGCEPYFGATFANHWITRPAPEVQLAPGETLASRTYVGDGLIQLNVGIELRAKGGVGTFVEYAIWLPAQDDPGDHYAFVTTHVFAIGIHAFSPRPGEFR